MNPDMNPTEGVVGIGVEDTCLPWQDIVYDSLIVHANQVADTIDRWLREEYARRAARARRRHPYPHKHRKDLTAP